MGTLTVRFVDGAKPREGRRVTKHHDRDGLLLRLERGARSWVWRGVAGGKRREVGLGPAVGSEATRRTKADVTLAEARKLARRCRDAAEAGDDPKTIRVQARRSGVPTFGEVAEKVIDMRAPGWRDSGRTEAQWRASLRDHAAALLDMPVNKVDAAAVLGVLIPHWHERPETANRVRVRIAAVLRFALAQGHRADDPTEAVKAALPTAKREKLHHAAVEHRDVADVLAKVRGHRAWWGTRLAVTFCTLTATRSGEARQARWSEVDLESKVWTVPGSRSKVDKDLRVPLSPQALAVLDEARKLGTGGDVIFPRARGPQPVAGGVLMALLRELNTGTTLHGMARASFRSWAADTGERREDAEAALGHVVPGVEGAYQRSDLLTRRAGLMDRWGAYCTRT